MDTKLKNLIAAEKKRQETTLNLIASENLPSSELLSTLGSHTMSKYSEGYPDRRYYPGNAVIDDIEKLAKARALNAFKTGPSYDVNVQPYSGSPANLAILLGLLGKHGTVIGLRLDHGGHLTHGHGVSATGIYYTSKPYTVTSDGDIDYAELERIAEKTKGPKVIISGTTAYPRTIDFKRIQRIAKKTGAYHVADISHVAGLVVAGLYPSPFAAGADAVMTTTHKTLNGPRGAVIFYKKEYRRAIDRAVFPGLQGGPHDNVTAAKALCFRNATTGPFVRLQKQTVANALTLADALKKSGYELFTDGTDCHLLVMRAPDRDGKGLERVLEKSGIIANRNSLPGDASPLQPSGVRMGTPCLTTRGMRQKEMKLIASLIDRCIRGESVASEVRTLARQFPFAS